MIFPPPPPPVSSNHFLFSIDLPITFIVFPQSSISCGNVEMARVLIQGGADLNIKDECGDSPLQMAAIGNHLDIVDLLVASGADVSGFSP